MKKFLIICLLGMLMTGCGESAENFSASEDKKIPAVEEEVGMKIKILIGDKIFDATLEDNATTREFAKNLPLEVTMTELNGNEKYYRFGKNFPSADKKVGEIRVGDLMLYSSSYVVLFYKNFATSYSYTRLGKIDNPAELEKIVGTGNISVRFEK